jgi:hypothetical protein
MYKWWFYLPMVLIYRIPFTVLSSERFLSSLELTGEERSSNRNVVQDLSLPIEPFSKKDEIALPNRGKLKPV